MSLTGRFSFRRSFTGKIILQIEEDLPQRWPSFGKSLRRRRWRNASLADLAEPQMRALMDLRTRPMGLYGPSVGGSAANAVGDERIDLRPDHPAAAQGSDPRPALTH